MNSSNFLIKASSCNADNTCSRLFFCHPTCFGSNICKRKKWRGLEKRFFYFWNFRFWSFVSKWRHFSPNISSHSLSRQSQSVSWSIARVQHPTSLYKKSSQQDTCNSSSSKSYYSFGRDTSRRRGRRKTSPQNNPTKTSLSTGDEFNVHKIVQPSIFGWTSSLFCQSVTAPKKAAAATVDSKVPNLTCVNLHTPSLSTIIPRPSGTTENCDTFILQFQSDKKRANFLTAYKS